MAPTAPLIEGWPHVVLCEGDGGSYEIAYQRIRGRGGNAAYTNGPMSGAYINFDESRTIVEVLGGSASFEFSDCFLENTLDEVSHWLSLPRRRLG